MMADARNLEKKSTARSALGILAIVLGFIVIGGVILYVISQPGAIESLLTIVILAVVVISAAAFVVYAAMGLMAVPLYAMKGEAVQKDVDYSLDSVGEVDGKTVKDEDISDVDDFRD